MSNYAYTVHLDNAGKIIKYEVDATASDGICFTVPFNYSGGWTRFNNLESYVTGMLNIVDPIEVFQYAPNRIGVCYEHIYDFVESTDPDLPDQTEWRLRTYSGSTTYCNIDGHTYLYGPPYSADSTATILNPFDGTDDTGAGGSGESAGTMTICIDTYGGNSIFDVSGSLTPGVSGNKIVITYFVNSSRDDATLFYAFGSDYDYSFENGMTFDDMYPIPSKAYLILNGKSKVYTLSTTNIVRTGTKYGSARSGRIRMAATFEITETLSELAYNIYFDLSTECFSYVYSRPSHYVYSKIEKTTYKGSGATPFIEIAEEDNVPYYSLDGSELFTRRTDNLEYGQFQLYLESSLDTVKYIAHYHRTYKSQIEDGTFDGLIENDNKIIICENKESSSIVDVDKRGLLGIIPICANDGYNTIKDVQYINKSSAYINTRYAYSKNYDSFYNTINSLASGEESVLNFYELFGDTFYTSYSTSVKTANTTEYVFGYSKVQDFYCYETRNEAQEDINIIKEDLTKTLFGMNDIYKLVGSEFNENGEILYYKITKRSISFTSGIRSVREEDGLWYYPYVYVNTDSTVTIKRLQQYEVLENTKVETIYVDHGLTKNCLNAFENSIDVYQDLYDVAKKSSDTVITLKVKNTDTENLYKLKKLRRTNILYVAPYYNKFVGETIHESLPSLNQWGYTASSLPYVSIDEWYNNTLSNSPGSIMVVGGGSGIVSPGVPIEESYSLLVDIVKDVKTGDYIGGYHADKNGNLTISLLKVSDTTATISTYKMDVTLLADVVAVGGYFAYGYVKAIGAYEDDGEYTTRTVTIAANSTSTPRGLTNEKLPVERVLYRNKDDINYTCVFGELTSELDQLVLKVDKNTSMTLSGHACGGVITFDTKAILLGGMYNFFFRKAVSFLNANGSILSTSHAPDTFLAGVSGICVPGTGKGVFAGGLSKTSEYTMDSSNKLYNNGKSKTYYRPMPNPTATQNQLIYSYDDTNGLVKFASNKFKSNIGSDTGLTRVAWTTTSCGAAVNSGDNIYTVIGPGQHWNGSTSYGALGKVAAGTGKVGTYYAVYMNNQFQGTIVDNDSTKGTSTTFIRDTANWPDDTKTKYTLYNIGTNLGRVGDYIIAVHMKLGRKNYTKQGDYARKVTYREAAYQVVVKFFNVFNRTVFDKTDVYDWKSFHVSQATPYVDLRGTSPRLVFDDDGSYFEADSTYYIDTFYNKSFSSLVKNQITTLKKLSIFNEPFLPPTLFSFEHPTYGWCTIFSIPYNETPNARMTDANFVNGWKVKTLLYYYNSGFKVIELTDEQDMFSDLYTSFSTGITGSYVKDYFFKFCHLFTNRKYAVTENYIYESFGSYSPIEAGYTGVDNAYAGYIPCGCIVRDIETLEIVDYGYWVLPNGKTTGEFVATSSGFSETISLFNNTVHRNDELLNKVAYGGVSTNLMTRNLYTGELGSIIYGDANRSWSLSDSVFKTKNNTSEETNIYEYIG